MSELSSFMHWGARGKLKFLISSGVNESNSNLNINLLKLQLDG